MNAKLLDRGLKALDLELDLEARDRLLFFAEELLRWNKKVNLTAITRQEEVVEKHLLDSLTLLPLLGAEERLLDIGSGGGFPVMPLKIARPQIEAVSVDAVQKKILFQRHAARLLKLDGFAALHGRIETLAVQKGMGGAFTTVVSRALCDLATFATWAAPFVAPSGQVLAMKGREVQAELAAAGERLAATGLEVVAMEEIHLPFSGGLRHIVVLRPILKTPRSSLF